VRAAVIAGQGFSISSRWMFAPELKSGDAVPVLEERACRQLIFGWFTRLAD